MILAKGTCTAVLLSLGLLQTVSADDFTCNMVIEDQTVTLGFQDDFTCDCSTGNPAVTIRDNGALLMGLGAIRCNANGDTLMKVEGNNITVTNGLLGVVGTNTPSTLPNHVLVGNVTNSRFESLLLFSCTNANGVCVQFDQAQNSTFFGLSVPDNREGGPTFVFRGATAQDVSGNLFDTISASNVEEILTTTFPNRPTGNFLDVWGEYNTFTNLKLGTIGSSGEFTGRFEGDYNIIEGDIVGSRTGLGLVVNGNHNFIQFTDRIETAKQGIVLSGTNNTVNATTFVKRSISTDYCIELQGGSEQDSFVLDNNVTACPNAIVIKGEAGGNNILHNTGDIATSVFLDENVNCGTNIWRDNIGIADLSGDDCVLEETSACSIVECNGSCEVCDGGSCVPVPIGEDPNSGCANGGFCDGEGACTSPREFIFDLAAFVKDTSEQISVRNLERAAHKLQRGLDLAAVNQLNAFINQVQAAQQANKLTESQADYLIEMVGIIIALIEEEL